MPELTVMPPTGHVKNGSADAKAKSETNKNITEPYLIKLEICLPIHLIQPPPNEPIKKC
ncbi:MAG: hypothetical protein V1672_02345 [Candidatus Diapherotrites archaeon]